MRGVQKCRAFFLFWSCFSLRALEVLPLILLCLLETLYQDGIEVLHGICL